MCERTDLVNQELYILNKVKEAKKEKLEEIIAVGRQI